MNNNTTYNNYSFKKHFDRTIGFPDKCPLQCYLPKDEDIPKDSLEIIIGMDSGVTNLAFSYIELVKDNNGAVIDYIYKDSYYFAEELNGYIYQIDKQLFLANKYYDLFAHKKVRSLTFEVLSLNTTKEQTLKALIDTQTTTSLISTVAYSLGHRYHVVPATQIKYCITGNGRASKSDMCLVAKNLTNDERLLLNDHMADSFCNCIFEFIQILKEDCKHFSKEIPDKFKTMVGR